MVKMTQMMKQQNGTYNIRDFNRVMAEYQVQNDMQKEMGEMMNEEF